MTKQDEQVVKRHVLIQHSKVIALGFVVIGIVIILIALLLIVRQANSNQQKTQNYVQCLARLAVESQSRPVTLTDIDTCTFQVGQQSQPNVTLPTGGGSQPQSAPAQQQPTVIVVPRPVSNPAPIPPTPAPTQVCVLGSCVKALELAN